MKFAKEMERDLVPEWRLKYMNYKLGKKKLKAISKALRNVNQTPRTRRRGTSTFMPSPFENAPEYSFLNRNHPGRETGRAASGNLRALAISNSQSSSIKSKPNGSQASLPRAVPRTPEEQPLRGDNQPNSPGLTRYGSIIGSPPDMKGRRRPPPSFRLPGAALDPVGTSLQPGPASAADNIKSNSVTLPPLGENGNAFEVGKTRSPHRSPSDLPLKYRSIFSPRRVNSTPGPENPRPAAKRLFSLSGPGKSPEQPPDVPLEAYRDVDMRQAEFFHFLDMELDKIESFYKEKEDEATQRLHVLREQLHIMRDTRMEELIAKQTTKMKSRKRSGAAGGPLLNGPASSDDDMKESNGNGHKKVTWSNPVDAALDAVKSGRHGSNTKSMHDLGTPSALRPRPGPDDNRDYSRRPGSPDVPYHTAKRKLKVAMQEFYRGLELLKSYALLNRTAFRKINKKYDKTVNARPSMRYMNEKVNKTWFVQSDVLEGHIRAVEDLYARYFEKGNHKVAVGKLRIKSARAGDYNESTFRNGLTLAAGLVFGIQGLVYGVNLLYDHNSTVSTDTSYLLQLYAGYFFVNLLFFFFCMACRVWSNSKINYAFVFEYDTRHHLDWRQLCELPCLFFFLLGLSIWLNFSQYGGSNLYIYYPVILVAVTFIILFFPAPVLYHRSRAWLLYSTWRLSLAGLYPVEFRDFFLGDMFCSLTYTMGNIELFFCLYANRWGNPVQCNSSHSRLLGFLAALPGIWRGLQCVRRYYDTRNVFPHLVNCGKYTATIVFYMTLSIYRISRDPTHRAVFITFAIINSIYTSVWDVFMDWSLGDLYAPHRFLRETLGYKKYWMYYAAIPIDIILRFNWIPYAIWPIELQHSAILSFTIAASEICRRGMWTVFRVENEHCTNVGKFRASRDVALPYDVPSSPKTGGEEDEEWLRRRDEEQPTSPRPPAPTPGLHPDHAETLTPSANLENVPTPMSSQSRRRTQYFTPAPEESPITRSLNRVGTMMRNAHAQDFEKKKKPELGAKVDDDSDDENSDDDVGTGPSVSGSEHDGSEDSDGKDAEDIMEARVERDVGSNSKSVAE